MSMSRIVISTSSSGLDNLNINNKIDLIRLRLIVNNVEFIDGKNITNERLQNLMTGPLCSAVRTQPAPAHEVEKLFTSLYQQGYKEVFVTTLSSKLSESYNIIKEVADSFLDRMDIVIYDCKELNMCEGMLALEAEHMMNEGQSMSQIVQRLDQLRAHHKMLFVVDDLSFLIRNKKLSATSGFFASLLKIKPVLQVTDDGEVIAVNKVRKLERALDHIVEALADSIKRSDTFAYILTTGCSNLDQHFVALIKQRTGVKSIPVLPVSNISLANQGPTGVGLCVFSGEIPHAAKYYQEA